MIINSVIYFFICFLQPIVLPLPEPLTIMTGSAVLGRLNGAILGFLGTTLGILTMYLISRFFGEKLVLKIVKKEKLESFNEYIRKNETLILLLLFIFPLLPDEVICIGSGIAKINGYKFFIVASISKIITAFTLSYSIELFNFDIQTLIIFFTLGMGIIWVKSRFENKRA